MIFWIAFISTPDQIDKDMGKQTADFEFSLSEIWYLSISDPGKSKFKTGRLLFQISVYFVWCRNEKYSE